jgi:hypothetical protein
VLPQEGAEALDDGQRVVQRLALQRASSEGRTSLPGWPRRRAGAAGATGAAHQQVQRVDQVARQHGVEPVGATSACQPRGRALFAHAVLQRQRAHAVHDGEGAQLLQVQRLLVAFGGQPLEPVAGS